MSGRGGDASAGGSAWGNREESSWWPGNGEMQNQQQQSDQVPRSGTGTQQMFTYKVTSGFPGSNSDQSNLTYEYRPANASSRGNEGIQTHWWYTHPGTEQQHSPSSDQPSPHESEGHHSPERRQVPQQSLQSQQTQQNIQQSIQQAIQQQQVIQLHNQQTQTLQQTLQQQQLALQESQHQHLQALQQAACFSDLQLSQAILNQQTHRMPRAKVEVKPRGRMTAYAFFLQSCREEHKRERPDENLVFAEFSKKCAERWNSMSDKEKTRFHELAEQDKKRYEFEMESYVPPRKDLLVGRKGKKKKQVKDPNAPKRSLSAFFWFCNDERAKVKAAFPTYAMGDIAKELGRRWASCDPATKGKYESLSEKDKARYDQEMTAYKKGSIAMNLTEDVEEYE